MKIVDQHYSYSVSSFWFGRWSLQCRLRVFQPHPEVELVMLTDLSSLLRWLIPNLLENMVNQVVQDFHLNPARLIWVEPSAYKFRPLTIADFVEITFETRNGKAVNPKRTAITPQLVQVLLNESLQLLEEVV